MGPEGARQPGIGLLLVSCLAWGTVELGFKSWKPVNWQSGIVFGKSSFLSIYPSILGTEFGSGVWPGWESF